jgi:acetylglutamate kinase
MKLEPWAVESVGVHHLYSLRRSGHNGVLSSWAKQPSGGRSKVLFEEEIRKADNLIEAMPYIRTFAGRYTVIKLGGSIMEEPEALRALLVDVVFMQTVGLRPVVVHGGGKAIDAAMARAGLEPRWVQGRRYTDERTLEIVARVLAEDVNTDIVRHINKFGGRAAGLHHRTAGICLFGRRLTLAGLNGEATDLGRVGEVTEVEVEPIEAMCLGGVVPVLPSLAEDDDGGLLNVNADTAAAAVAEALHAEKLVFLTDAPGICRDVSDPSTLVRSMTPSDARGLIAEGVIGRGMIPKLEACLASLEAGVRKIHIIDGRLRHALLLEIFTHEGIGTMIGPNGGALAEPPPRRASVAGRTA